MKAFLLTPLLLMALPVQASKFTIVTKANAPVYLRIGYGLNDREKEHWIDCLVDKPSFDVVGAKGESVKTVQYTLNQHHLDSLKDVASRTDLIKWAKHYRTGTTQNGHWLVYISNGPDGKPAVTMDPDQIPLEVRNRFPAFKPKPPK